MEKVNKKLLGFSKGFSDALGYKVGDSLLVQYEHYRGFWKLRKFSGICISKRQKGLATSFVLRNVVYGTGVEFEFFLFSTINFKISRLPFSKFERVRPSKLYYLRHKRLHLSKVIS